MADNQQPLDDGQGERQVEGYGRALARMATDLYHAADLVHVGLHDIHAYPSTGDVTDSFYRAEAGHEDDFEQLLLTHGRSLLFCE